MRKNGIKDFKWIFYRQNLRKLVKIGFLALVGFFFQKKWGTNKIKSVSTYPWNVKWILLFSNFDFHILSPPPINNPFFNIADTIHHISNWSRMFPFYDFLYCFGEPTKKYKLWNFSGFSEKNSSITRMLQSCLLIASDKDGNGVFLRVLFQ